nr:hypothetical protein [Desulfopila sp. IMCC35006]
MMHDKRIGGQGQQFVEQQEGDQIAGEGHAGGRSDAQAEKAKETAAMGRAFQIADGIDGGHQPEHRREGDKEQRQRIGKQYQLEIWQ